MNAPVTVTMALVAVSLVVAGVLLVLKRVLVAGGLLTLVGVLVGAGVAARAAGSGDLAADLVAAGGVGALPLALLAYPRLRHRHVVDVLAVAALLAAPVVLLSGTAPAEAVGLASAVVLVAHTWWRVETAGDDRAALVWMATTVGVLVVVVGVVAFAADGAEASLAPAFVLTSALGPLLVVGVRDPDVVDVRGVVTGFAVASTVVLVHVSLFVVVVGLLAALGLTSPSLGTLALVGAVVALTAHPVQRALRGSVDALLFGERPDPLGAATTLADRVGDDPAATLEVLRHTLVLPWVALEVDGVVVATAGQAVPHTRALDLGGQGRLVVGLRAGDLTLSAADRRVLGLVVPLLAQTLRARALSAALQESREQTVTAVEEERRRLRRDLHDGLGPRLSGIAFTLDAVRNLLRHDPDQATDLVVTLRAETTTAIEDVRRLVYAMRPPALDELGLVPALRQQTLGLRTPDGEPLAVVLSAPPSLGELPAAVEVAAYRIVMEALTNVARHSRAGSATVALARDARGLSVEVCDPGRAAAPWSAGVGLSSMRERAAELGGTLTAGPLPDGGRVLAHLPLPAAP